MMKILVIITLILTFFCNQSHHQAFLFLNSGTFGLATEEFIPVGSEAPSEQLSIDKIGSFQESTGVGSQNHKADNANPQETSSSSQFVETKTEKSLESSNNVEKEPLNPQVHSDSSSSTLVDEPQNSRDGVESETKSHTFTPPAFAAPQVDTPPTETLVDTENVSEDLNKSKINVPSSNSAGLVENDLDGNNDTAIAVEQQEVSSDKLESHELDAHPSKPKEEEPIPSFMEWTQLQQQKLHESAQSITGSGQMNGHNGNKNNHATNSQQNKSLQTGNQANGVKDRKDSNAKNFASPDCGAKVIQSNPESQNANGVLSPSHDEYMLNKCGIPIWFVMELCEPLKIEKVSLGNLELFSSSPKDIEIGISDRYPTRDWTKLGPFTLPDVRAIHAIDFPATNASTFGKFLKVNILSHYGTEHYCPLSLVRVNGISEYEVLESENTHPEDISDVEKEENALYEEPIEDEHTVEKKAVVDKSVFGSAKDAVMNMVKKAAQALVKSDKSKDVSNADLNSECRSIVQCLPNYENQLKERVLSFLSCNFSDLLPFLSKNSPWCGWDYCHALFKKHSIGLPWQPEGFYASMFGGPSVLHALCNYHKPLSKDSCNAFVFTNESTTSKNEILGEGYINDSLKSPIPKVKLGTSVDESSADEGVEDEKGSKPNEEKGNIIGENKDNRVILTDGTNKELNVPEIEQSYQQASKNGETSATPVESTNIGDTQQQTVTSVPTVHTGTSPGTSDDVSQSQNQQQVNNNQQQASGQQQQQKESVFVRLSNRIKTLERNSSITVSYLEELSRRFKKQNEENNHINEGSKRFINESRTKFKTLEDLYKFELRSLRRNTDEIRERLFNVQLQRSVLILLCLIQFLGILSLCVWATRRFRKLEESLECRTTTQQANLMIPLSTHVSAAAVETPKKPQHNVLLGRKRINSDGSVGSSLNSFDKSKKIKRKKKKLTDLKPIPVKVAGPSSAPIEYKGNKPEEVFNFEYSKVPTSRSDYDLNLTSNFKENIKPELTRELEIVPDAKPILFGRESTIKNFSNDSGGAPPLSSKGDSPLSITSSTTSFYSDSVVSTSSRFALLASPGPGLQSKSTNLKRSGSLSSIDQSSVSSYGDKTVVSSIINGHGDNQSQGSNGSGKKRKNKGLKALMPKIFDR